MNEYSLDHYGACLDRYSGCGTITANGQRYDCRFECGQYGDGSVRMICEIDRYDGPEVGSCVDFDGQTDAGAQVRATGAFCCSCLHSAGLDGCRSVALLLPSDLEIVSVPDVQPACYKFGITNLVFTGTEVMPVEDEPELVIRHTLNTDLGALELMVVPVPQYEKISRRVTTLKGIDVTAEIVCRTRLPIEHVTSAVSDLCLVLSVGRGTKIQWVYIRLLDETGRQLIVKHLNRVRKRFGSMATIARKDRKETARLIREGIPALRALRKSAGSIDYLFETYLDARAEADYIQLRSAKVAIAVEALRTVLCKLPDYGLKEYILEPTDFSKKIVPKLSAAMREAVRGLASTNDLEAICGEQKLLGLNRRSFRYHLEKLIRRLALDISRHDVKLFVASRNKLIHTGEFYCTAATETERAELPPLDSQIHEFLFMISILDQIVLTMLNYSGRYTDWRVPGQPQDKVLD